jgi:hypothetical protein
MPIEKVEQYKLLFMSSALNTEMRTLERGLEEDSQEVNLPCMYFIFCLITQV